MEKEEEIEEEVARELQNDEIEIKSGGHRYVEAESDDEDNEEYNYEEEDESDSGEREKVDVSDDFESEASDIEVCKIGFDNCLSKTHFDLPGKGISKVQQKNISNGYLNELENFFSGYWRNGK